MIEEREILLSVGIDILWLFQQHRAHKIVKDLPKFGVVLDVTNVLLFNPIFDLSEVGL
jgi:hypothetical protein